MNGIFTKYDVGIELGRGTFASVFRAMDRDTGKWYAIKIIQRAKFAHNPHNEKNFQREIEILSWINHVSPEADCIFPFSTDFCFSTA